MTSFFQKLGFGRHRRDGRMLEAVAVRRGGVLVRPGSTRYLPKFAIKYGPATITLTRGARWRRAASLTARVTLAAGEFPRFEVSPRGMFSRRPGLGVGGRFDRQFVVDCDDLDAVRSIWTPRAMALMNHVANPFLSGEGRLEAINGTITAQRRELRFRQAGTYKHESSYDMLLELLEELIDAATWVERSRPNPVA